MRQSAPPPRHTALADTLVAAQVALLGALLAPARATTPPARRASRPRRAAGVGLVAAGSGLALAGALALGPALTPSPRPSPAARLRTTGVYGRVRHPIYTGLSVAATGRALASGAPRHVLAAGALVGLFQVKARVEEALLVARFPGYRAYARRTPAWLPAPPAGA